MTSLSSQDTSSLASTRSSSRTRSLRSGTPARSSSRPANVTSSTVVSSSLTEASEDAYNSCFVCHTDQVQAEKSKESIKRFGKQDDETGKHVEMIDLDNSVFMNFKRYTKQDVTNCFKADMRMSSFENVVRDEQDVSILALL